MTTLSYGISRGPGAAPMFWGDEEPSRAGEFAVRALPDARFREEEWSMRVGVTAGSPRVSPVGEAGAKARRRSAGGERLVAAPRRAASSRGGEELLRRAVRRGFQVTDETLLSPEEVESGRRDATRLVDELNRAILGQAELNGLLVTACLARGHVLLEGLPGLGKTELVKSLAALLGLTYRRMQFTPDLLPSDITGGHILEEGDDGRRLVFHEGPVFGNVVLADEINRASPKTQAALLEAMAERRVTVLGDSRPLPDPFYVLATQNPIELEGTYPLPEAQLDRFLFKLDVGGADRATVETIIRDRRRGRPPELSPVLDRDGLGRLFDVVDRVFLPKAVAAWIARLIEASHPGASSAPEPVKRYVKHGASPRAAIAIAESARGHALLQGRPNVGFDDVRAVAVAAVHHRLVLDYQARLDGITGAEVTGALLDAVSEVGDEFPEEARHAS